jgi:subtilisin family serine protease
MKNVIIIALYFMLFPFCFISKEKQAPLEEDRTYKIIQEIMNPPVITPFTSFVPLKKKIKIAVVDTGVDCSSSLLIPYLSSKNTSFDCQDPVGHGTSVTGVIVSNLNGIFGTYASNDVEIYSFRFELNSIGNMDSYKMALLRALAIQPDFINVSASGFAYDADEQLIFEAAKYLGIETFVAAGNDSLGFDVFPCAYPSVTCVGNIDSEGYRAESSNFGPNVSVYAFGQHVVLPLPDNRWAPQSGTSISAPLVLTKKVSLALNPKTDSLFSKAVVKTAKARPEIYWYAVDRLPASENK